MKVIIIARAFIIRPGPVVDDVQMLCWPSFACRPTLDAARRQMERAASKQGVREVTVRCIELHAKLQKKFAKQRRDGGGGTFLTEADAAAAAEGASGMAGLLSLLEGEQRDQERRAAVMACHYCQQIWMSCSCRARGEPASWSSARKMCSG